MGLFNVVRNLLTVRGEVLNEFTSKHIYLKKEYSWFYGIVTLCSIKLFA
jgi:hypothetical protein